MSPKLQMGDRRKKRSEDLLRPGRVRSLSWEKDGAVYSIAGGAAGRGFPVSEVVAGMRCCAGVRECHDFRDWYLALPFVSTAIPGEIGQLFCSLVQSTGRAVTASPDPRLSTGLGR